MEDVLENILSLLVCKVKEMRNMFEIGVIMALFNSLVESIDQEFLGAVVIDICIVQ